MICSSCNADAFYIFDTKPFCQDCYKIKLESELFFIASKQEIQIAFQVLLEQYPNISEQKAKQQFHDAMSYTDNFIIEEMKIEKALKRNTGTYQEGII